MDALDTDYVDELMTYHAAKAGREHEKAEAARMEREQDQAEAALRRQLGD